MEKMKPGSIVSLKSGGPEMTIRWIEAGEAYCEWFVGSKGQQDIKGTRLPLTSLDLVQE